MIFRNLQVLSKSLLVFILANCIIGIQMTLRILHVLYTVSGEDSVNEIRHYPEEEYQNSSLSIYLSIYINQTKSFLVRYLQTWILTYIFDRAESTEMDFTAQTRMKHHKQMSNIIPKCFRLQTKDNNPYVIFSHAVLGYLNTN